MLSEEQLQGNVPATYNEDEKCYVYTTNFGQVYLSQRVRKVVWASIVLCKGMGNKELEVVIQDKEFQVSRYFFSKVNESLSSPKYPYKQLSPTIEISDVLEVLILDDNQSIAATAVKKSLISLMRTKLKFNKSDNKLLQELFKTYRKPIIKRTSVK